MSTINSNLGFNHSTIRAFSNLFDDLLFNTSIVTNDGVKTPVHDVIENDKEYVVEMLLAGVDKTNVSIEVEKDTLVVKAERKQPKDLKYNRKQSYYGKYERTFLLPDDVDIENITSTMSDGVLKITFPKLDKSNIPGKKTININ